MTKRTDRMKLGAFFHPTGNHVAAWLHPDAQIDAGVNFRHYVELAQTAERAKFDLIFIADAIGTRAGDPNALRRWPQYMCFFDPMSLLAGLAAVTSRIGLVATASTTFNEPYNLARRLAALDHMSQGRAGWNVVTSSNFSEPPNFGQESLPSHDERYERALEFVDVVRGLLDSWDDDAFLRDRQSAVYYDPAKLHVLDHRGKYFASKGPLNMARPPQGCPVLAQASASSTGMEASARIAEIVFSPLLTIEKGQAFYRDLKARAVAHGRSPDDIKLMPGLNPVVGRTEAEAKEKHAYLQSLIHDDVGRALLSTALNDADLSHCDPDEPLPRSICEAVLATDRSEGHMIVAMAQQEGMTLRQSYQRYAGARGQRTVVGTASQIVDHMEAWFHGRAVDGFLIQPPVLPLDLDDIVQLIVPELQNRGLFRTEYEGETLRENLGLKRPASRYAM